MLDELIKSSVLLGQNFVGNDVLLPQKGIHVLDEFHGNDFVGKLVIILV